MKSSDPKGMMPIVFDASAKQRDNNSINDCLEEGPNLFPDLLRILLRFRLHTYAITAECIATNQCTPVCL